MLIGIQTGIQSPAALRQPMMQGFPVQINRGTSSSYPYHQVKFSRLHLWLFQINIQTISYSLPSTTIEVFSLNQSIVNQHIMVVEEVIQVNK